MILLTEDLRERPLANDHRRGLDHLPVKTHEEPTCVLATIRSADSYHRFNVTGPCFWVRARSKRSGSSHPT